MLAASTLPSWEPWEHPERILGRSWDIREYKKGHCEVQACFFRFLVDLGDPFKEIFRYMWTEKHGFFISISRLLFLMIFGSEFGCLGLETQAFGKGGIAKISFCRNWIYHDSRDNFYDFWWPWDQFSWLLLPWRLA